MEVTSYMDDSSLSPQPHTEQNMETIVPFVNVFCAEMWNISDGFFGSLVLTPVHLKSKETEN